ncbi:MAG: ATP-binding protein [Bdellovibrionia bacterium]
MPKLQAAEREFRRRFWWAISIPLVLMAILATFFAFETSRLNNAMQAMSRSNTVLIHTARLRRAIIDTETDAQQFLRAQNPSRLKSYEDNQARLPDIVRDLQQAQGITEQQRLKIAQAYDNWRMQTNLTVRSPQLQAQRASVDRDSWDALLRSLDDVLQVQIAERALNAAAAQNLVHRGALFGIGLVLIIGILLSLFTRRQLQEIALRYRTAILDATDKAQAAHQALVSRDDFFSIASHELKTPITTMELRLHTLQSALDRAALSPSSRGAVNSAMRSLKRQNHRLSELVENILDVTQINSGQMHLNRSQAPVAVESLIQRSIQATREILEQSNCRIDLQLEAATARNWDGERIIQALKALISNSAKYAPNSTIEIKSELNQDQIRIAVTDHGLGIASKDHPRIFRLFERGVSSRHYGGLGTGLYITREIIEAHQGSIRVISREGAGATVIIDLPLSAETKREAA